MPDGCGRRCQAVRDPDAWGRMPGAALGRAADVCSWSVVWQRRDVLTRKNESVRVFVGRAGKAGGSLKKFFGVPVKPRTLFLCGKMPETLHRDAGPWRWRHIVEDARVRDHL